MLCHERTKLLKLLTRERRWISPAVRPGRNASGLMVQANQVRHGPSTHPKAAPDSGAAPLSAVESVNNPLP
jgi:hypothetical protein